MKKILLALTIIVALAVTIWYFFFFAPAYKVQPFHLIPQNSAYILTAEQPVSSWNKLSGSNIWQHLKNNPKFESITNDINYIDSLVQENGWLDFAGNKEVLISVHPVRTGYDFLYMLDLGKGSRLSGIKYYLQNILGEDYRITYRTIEGIEITEIYIKDLKETLHIAFVENLVIASFVPSLTEAVIKQSKSTTTNDAFQEITDKVGYSGLFRVYINYNQFIPYLHQFAQDNPAMANLRHSLLYSGFTVDYEDDIFRFDGYTNYRDSVNSYLKALHSSGMGGHDFLEITPENTPYFMAMGFDDLSSFVNNLEKALHSNPDHQKEYRENRKQIEDFLDIDLNKHFIDWVDDEMVLIQNQPVTNSNIREFALLLQTTDANKATKGLNYIQDQIRKKTPVKIKGVTYKGHTIQYMAMKGFFKLFFGKLFDKIEKPYYTQIDDWVIFSNHPRTLKNIIDAVDTETVLSENEAFNAYYSDLEHNTAVFAYINTPLLFEDIKQMAEKDDRNELEKNKSYITCFSNISFQLTKADNLFYSALHTRFESPTLPEMTIDPTNKPELIDTADVEHKKQETPWKDIYKQKLASIDKIVIPDLTADEFKSYYDNGQLKYEVNLKDGWKHGSFKSYFENGEKQFKGRYRDDKKDGTWRIYNKKGEQIDKIKYDEGKPK